MTTGELKKLYAERADLNERISDIEAEARRKQHSGLVGKTFIYMNAYSSSDRWPLYTLVLAVNEDGWLSAFQFETKTDDEISIRPSVTRLSMGDGYREIPRSEFDEAWFALVGRMARLPRTETAQKQPKAA